MNSHFYNFYYCESTSVKAASYNFKASESKSINRVHLSNTSLEGYAAGLFFVSSSSKSNAAVFGVEYPM